MKFKVPFTFSSTEILKRKSKWLAEHIRTSRKTFSSLQEYLKVSDSGLNKDEYIAIAIKTFFISYIFIAAAVSTILYFLNYNYFYGIIAAFLFAFFILANQISYPKIYCQKKARNIEKNLISAMQDMLVQLNSGVAIFKILVNIASSNYGEVSQEIGKTVKEINSGKPQVEAIEELGNRTSSIYFRRVLWQISNGMRSGSDMSVVIKDNIDSLGKEQNIQIQNYGSKLNPLIMFYMLLTVIIPALALTFLTIISSMVNFSGLLVKGMFVGIFILVVILQILFLGMIKSRRPSLL